MKTALFIDRDGTLIVEPIEDQQVDSLEKLEFIPGVFSGLSRIRQLLDAELVMVTNQDGLGTSSFPEETFWPAHNKMMKAFQNEGVEFDNVIIDRTLPADNAPTRKPGTALLTQYLDGSYDMNRCYVIGDRATDVQLAQNLGAKAIFFSNDSHPAAVLNTTSWNEIFSFLALAERGVCVTRKTNETDITIQLSLDGDCSTDIHTGLGFFDHMLEQLAKHSGCSLTVHTCGDLHIDEHHTVEDTALALGEAYRKALGNKLGVERYGYCLPMDDAQAQVALDFSGRPWFIWSAEFKREKVGDLPTELFPHFFKSFSDAARCNLHIEATGDNEHHKIEAIFKAVARSLRMAVRRAKDDLSLPSTKGLL